MDNKFTQDIQDWLNLEPAKRDMIKGAEMLLKLNRNRYLFQNIIRKPEKFMSKVESELKKHLTYRLDQLTIDEVIKMDETLIPAVTKLIDDNVPVISSDDDKPQDGVIAKGRREDHESLPEEIRALFENSGNLYFKIKTVFEQLKTMNKAQPCDRYELLKQLSELDSSYRSNMATYDHYDPNAVHEPKQDELPADPAEISKKVNAARKYLSDNKPKLVELLSNNDTKKHSALLIKVQERYDFLVSTGNNIDEQQVEALVQLGLKK